jgi:hypothetical protein
VPADAAVPARAPFDPELPPTIRFRCARGHRVGVGERGLHRGRPRQPCPIVVKGITRDEAGTIVPNECGLPLDERLGAIHG